MVRSTLFLASLLAVPGPARAQDAPAASDPAAPPAAASDPAAPPAASSDPAAPPAAAGEAAKVPPPSAASAPGAAPTDAGAGTSSLSPQALEQADLARTMATLAMRQGDLAAAQAELDRLLTLLPEDATGRYYLGLIAGREGRWADSLAELRRARAGLPEEVRWPIALALLRSGDADAALAELDGLPGGRAAYLRGVVLEALDRDEEALAAYEAGRGDSADPQGLLAAGFYGAALLAGRGELDRATQWLAAIATEANAAPWDLAVWDLHRRVRTLGLQAAAGLAYDSNVNLLNDLDFAANGVADLRLALDLAASARWAVSQALRLTGQAAFSQHLYLLEGPSSRAYNLTELSAQAALAYGLGQRPGVNAATLAYSLSGAWVPGAAHRDDVGLSFFSLTHALGPSARWFTGHGQLQAGYELQLADYDDTVFVAALAPEDDRDALGHRLHAGYLADLGAWQLGGALEAGLADAAGSHFDRGWVGLTAQGTWQPSARRLVQASLQPSLTWYDDLRAKPRRDVALAGALWITNRLDASWDLALGLSYLRRHSTIEAYQYDRILVSLRTQWAL